MARYALLLPWEEAWLEVLPPGAGPQDVGLQEGRHHYSSSLGPGARLFWRQSPLSWQANPHASALCGAHVCGEAVLALAGPFDSESQLYALLTSLLARAAPRRQLPPAPQGWLPPGRAAERQASSCSARTQPHAAPRCKLAGPAASCDGGGMGGGGSGGGICGGGSGSGVSAGQSSSAPPTSAAAAVAGAAALPGDSGAGFEPRQHLLWTIASRATSISWAPSSPSKVAAGSVGPDAVAGAAQQQRSAVPTHPDHGSQGGGASTAAGPACSRPCSGPPTGVAAAATASSSPGDGSASGGRRCAEGMGEGPGGHPAAAWAAPDWELARPEIIALIVAQAGYSSAFAQLVSQVCSGWRQAVREERGMLRQLQFRRLALAAPHSGPPQRPGSLREWAQMQRLPWLVMEAARAGSVSAAVVAARHLEAHSPLASELPALWGKAARRGHPEAQAKLGLAFYKGTLGLACDAEEAILWLSRAAKQLTEHLAVPHTGSAASAGALSLAAGAGAGAAGAAGALLMSPADCRRCLSQVAHMLGLLHLDGEGTRRDLVAGIRWLKVAEQHGCMEAGMVLGSLYNTGQYG